MMTKQEKRDRIARIGGFQFLGAVIGSVAIGFAISPSWGWFVFGAAIYLDGLIAASIVEATKEDER